MRFSNTFLILFLLTFSTFISFGYSLICPSSEEIPSCKCNPDDAILTCNGSEWTQTQLESTFRAVRSANGVQYSSQIVPLTQFKLEDYQSDYLDLGPFMNFNFKELILDGNTFTYISTSQSGLIQVDSLSVVGCSLTDDGAESLLKRISPNFLKSLNLSRNKLKTLSYYNNGGSLLPTFLTLRNLDVSQNRIVKLTGKEFGGLGGLSYLNLSNNRLHELPKDFFVSFQDDSVDFDLVDVPWTIDLSFNNLTDGNVESGKKTRLQNIRRPTTLNLSYNSFVQLSAQNFQTFLFASGQNRIVMDGNLILCGETMNWIKDARILLEERVTGMYCVNDEEATLFTTEMF